MYKNPEATLASSALAAASSRLHLRLARQAVAPAPACDSTTRPVVEAMPVCMRRVPGGEVDRLGNLARPEDKEREDGAQEGAA